MPATSREVFGLTVLNNNHSDIRALRRQYGQPSHHGNKVWRSSLLLMDYLQEFPIEQGARVLEVGCGWGLTGIYCAKQFNAQVTCLDIDPSVIPYVEHHAGLNGVNVTTWVKGYQAVTASQLQSFDVIVGGDICFWDDLSKLLFNMARRAQKAGIRTIITDPGRPPFTDMATRACEKLSAECDAWFVPHPHNARGYVLDVPAT